MGENYGLYHCTECKGSFPFENIKYGFENNLVCVDCFSKSNKRSGNLGSGFGAYKNDSNIIKFICIDCRYHFSLKKDSKISRICPYCGKNKLMVDEATANKLIDEASKNIDNYY